MSSIDKLRERYRETGVYPPEVERALKSALKDESSRVQARAIAALGRAAERDQRKWVYPYARSNRKPLRQTEAFRALCEKPRRDELSVYYQGTKAADWETRELALDCYRNLPNERRVKTGFTRALYLAIDPIPRVQKKALDMLVWYRDRRAIPFLVRYSRRNDISEISQKYLIRAMAHFSHGSIVRQLVKLLKSESHPIRWEAQKALKKISANS